MSAYVLARVLGSHERRVGEALRRLGDDRTRRFGLAELHDVLASLPADALRHAVAAPPPEALPPQVANYAAAMIEYACARNNVAAPGWTRAIAPLATPVFGSQLESLRLHLLVSSPPPFRSRNIYIDTSVGGRV